MARMPPVFGPALAGFLLCSVLLALARVVFPRIGLLDFPERYGLTRKRLPYPAGIAAVASFLLIFGALQPWSAQTVGILIAVGALGAVTFIDDRMQLPPLPRLALHVGVCCLLFWTSACTGGRICSLTNPFEGIIGGAVIELNGAWPVLSLLVTVGWLILTINALNWFDGIPGQVSVLSVIGFVTIGCLSLLRLNEPGTAAIAFLLAGIALACVLVDFPPARVIFGDSGAMFFGLMLGILTIYSGGKVATAFLVLGVPLVDSLIVIVRRVLKGKSPFKGSRDGEHLHHRLLQKGWHPRAVIALSAAIGTGFGVTALFLDTRGKFIAAGCLALLMLALSRYSRTSGEKKTIPV
jgi:UDP-GlcNAc:undecaprenyl-phosphate/decaprenyl-phosphate GlcNAc-1-phosphate transferase